MKGKKKLWCIAAIAASILFLQIAEWILNLNGLELRTAAKEIKEIYVWLIAPGIMLLLYFLFLLGRAKGRVEKGLSVLFALAGIALIWGTASFQRAHFRYLWNIEETFVSDDVIVGRHSGGTWKGGSGYYKVVCGIFRREFSGHEVDEITSIVQERYGAGAELVGDSEEAEFYTYRIAANDDDENYLYFVVDNNYGLTDNYLHRKMQYDAAQFWDGRRSISFVDEGINENYDTSGERWSREEYAGAEDPLVVQCYGRDDIDSCAVDITNWIYYALEDAGYGEVEEGKWLPTELRFLYIAVGEERFPFHIPEDTYWKDTDAWENNRKQIRIGIRVSISDSKREN